MPVVPSVVRVLFFAGLCSLTLACSPMENELTLAELAGNARAIVVGKVLKQYVDDRFDYGSGSTAYTAAMEVHCTYKGHVNKAVINITEAGSVPGHCSSSDLTVGGQFLVLLYVDGGRYSILDTQLDTDTMDARELTSNCGLQLRYKPGFEDDPSCPIPDNPECPTSVLYDYEDRIYASQSGSTVQAPWMWLLVAVCARLVC